MTAWTLLWKKLKATTYSDADRTNIRNLFESQTRNLNKHRKYEWIEDDEYRPAKLETRTAKES